MGDHLIDGEFQSDKYPTTPRGKVPLSVKDPMAQDLLWEYARRRRVVDTEFSDDLEEALRLQGSAPRQAVSEAMIEAGLIELNKFYDVTRFALPPSAVMRRTLEAALLAAERSEGGKG